MRNYSTYNIFYIILFLSGPVVLVFSQSSPFLSRSENAINIPENYEIRRKLESWINAPVNEARSASMGVFRQSSDGNMIKVRTEDTRESFYQLFLIEQDYSYSVARKGNFIIKRDKTDGTFLQVKVFLRNEPGSFLRIFPSGDRSILDIYLLGHRLFGNIIIPLNINQVFTTSMEQIMKISSSRVDWSVFSDPPSKVMYEEKTAVMKEIRNQLYRLYDCDDGAMNRNGEFVYIETMEEQDVNPGGFNCSGFVKWLADGFVLPVNGELLDIVDMKLKHSEYRGNSWSDFSEDTRDPYFGLDWTRNIAVSLLFQRNFGEKYSNDPDNRFSPEAADVREVPFFSYIEDVGWSVSDLEAVLYLLAMNEPGNFYLGSLNIPYGDEHILRQHTHVVALFPYFSSLGEFRVAVFERNQETSIESIEDRYGSDFIHLVRISAEGDFILP